MPTVSRRAVLAGLVASGGLLAGCGLRLDLPQPPPPVPTRESVPDEHLLVGFVHDVRGLLALGELLSKADRAGAPVGDALRLLREQDTVLTGRLTNEGVPTSVIDAAQGPATSGATSAAPGPASGPAAFGRVLVAVPSGRWESIASASANNRTVLLSATSARLAVAAGLGTTVPLSRTGPQTLHTALVEHTAPLVYGFEVVAAQSVDAARKAALGTLDAVRRLLADLGPELPGGALPGGWQLPYPVTTPEAAARLAKDLLAHAIDATTTLLQTSVTAAGLAEVATWSARVQALGPAHGIPLMAFPGTSGAARP
ncbi:MAG: hypothetical protein ACTHJJ_11715 [Intrasporangium sp.]|uniref:hypothetical protein n=1 Tax=Intrasporangium sp. TaxID=1925024 RepID=UPI003F7FDFE8